MKGVLKVKIGVIMFNNVNNFGYGFDNDLDIGMFLF